MKVQGTNGLPGYKVPKEKPNIYDGISRRLEEGKIVCDVASNFYGSGSGLMPPKNGDKYKGVNYSGSYDAYSASAGVCIQGKLGPKDVAVVSGMSSCGAIIIITPGGHYFAMHIGGSASGIGGTKETIQQWIITNKVNLNAGEKFKVVVATGPDGNGESEMDFLDIALKATLGKEFLRMITEQVSVTVKDKETGKERIESRSVTKEVLGPAILEDDQVEIHIYRAPIDREDSNRRGGSIAVLGDGTVGLPPLPLEKNQKDQADVLLSKYPPAKP